MKTMPTVVQTILENQPVAQTIQRGLVMKVNSDSSVVVFSGGTEMSCDVLHASGEPVRLARGDTVLFLLPAGHEQGVVLGRIGPSHTLFAEKTEVPEELLLEAKQNLTLKCGDGSITLRADGKVLIKGKDLVSHAQRTNRVKGGSVAIN